MVYNDFGFTRSDLRVAPVRNWRLLVAIGANVLLWVGIIAAVRFG